MSKFILEFSRILGMILILLATGCSLDKKLVIDPGSYTVNGSGEGSSLRSGPFIQGIEIDQQHQELTITHRKGEPLRIPYLPRAEADWPAGCPGNIYSQRMETFDLQVDEETAAVLGFSDPVLVRNCPENPYILVLRGDGEIGGSSTACPFPDECLIFLPSNNAVEHTEYLELRLEEMDREMSEVEDWAQFLVDGYGPGIWYFSSFERPVFHHTPESLDLEGIVRELNELFEADQIPTIRVEGQIGSTVRVSLSDDRQLTQGMGSAGAQGYLQVVQYSLTSLPEVDCVDFQFQEGDHAQPGLLCRSGFRE